MSPTDKTTIVVEIQFHDVPAGQQAPSSRVYLFDGANRLVDSKSVTPETKSVSFEIDSNVRYRITVGPDALAKRENVPPDLLTRLGKARAISQDYLPQLGIGRFRFAIYPGIWECWFELCILVHGHVRKALSTGGYAPLCSGTVQIFEVDLACTLDQLASFQLVALRNRLIERLTVPTAETQVRASVLGRATSAVRQSLRSARTLGAPAISTTPQRMTFQAARLEEVGSLSDAVAALRTLEAADLKTFLVANKLLLFPFWCELIPDSAFCWEELGEAPIQSDGSFAAEICFFCPEDFPDLYFEVVQSFDGVEREVYDPQIACSTYYDYDGSDDVLITVTDPTAVACLPPGNPGPDYLYVWPTAIGNIDLTFVDSLESSGGPSAGLAFSTDPWGGTLSLQMQFHPSLPTPQVAYYRWSYMFDGDPGFTQINATVTHRYATVTVLPGPIIVVHLNPVTLGPQPVGGQTNLFAIPDPTLDWVDIDDPVDRPFAYFNSLAGQMPGRSGMVTLMLELFDANGNFVPCNNALGSSTLGDQPGDAGPPGPFTFLLPQIPGPPATFSNAPPFNVTDHGRLIFRLHVDNNPTLAQLPGVSTPKGSADACGMLHYTNGSDNVDIQYVAFHPNNFLTWELEVFRGTSGLVASIPPSPPATNTSSGSPGTPAHFVNSASSLLGSCAEAAFAVDLFTFATATDGYGRQSEYDAFTSMAFALITP